MMNRVKIPDRRRLGWISTGFLRLLVSRCEYIVLLIRWPAMERQSIIIGVGRI